MRNIAVDALDYVVLVGQGEIMNFHFNMIWTFEGHQRCV